MKFTFTHKDLVENVGLQPTCFPKLQTLVDTWIVMFSGLSYLKIESRLFFRLRKKYPGDSWKSIQVISKVTPF